MVLRNVLFNQFLFIYLIVNKYIMKSVTISKTEYEKLKEVEAVDHELLIKIVKGFEDIRAGRIKKWE